jgi:diacylglycerol kinase
MRLSSFLDALRGLTVLLRTERNARVHAAASILAVALGMALGIDRLSWCWLITSMAMVWAAEAFNTAVERLADRVTQERDPLIKQAKDLAAGAVLVAALAAALIGLLVLGPPLWRWLRP